MTLGCDFAWQHPDPAAIRSAGYEFVIRYLSNDPTKNLTPTERDALWAQGLGILLVWESYATRALGGPQAGIDDARAATAEAQTLGYPVDVPLFFACDTNATADQARPYFKGAASIRPSVGAYGGIAVVDTLLLDGTVRYGWQTCAWSNNRVSQTAHLYQRLRPTRPLAGSFDEDVLLKPLPLWTAPSAVVAPPTPIPAPTPQPVSPLTVLEDDPMYIYAAIDGPQPGAEFYTFGTGKLVHIDGPTAQSLQAAPNPVTVKPVSWSMLQQAGATL